MPASREPRAVAWLGPDLYPDERFPEGRYVEVEEDGSFGALVVNVNEEPGDRVSAASHFELFEGDVEDYHFKVWPDGTPDHQQRYEPEDEA